MKRQDERPVGAVWMRCCRAWEEDENAVNYSSLTSEGYVHWRTRCQRSVAVTVPISTAVLRRADGLIWGMRVYSPKIIDTLYLLDRERDELQELRLYRACTLAVSR